jgi:hypothetical protein
MRIRVSGKLVFLIVVAALAVAWLGSALWWPAGPGRPAGPTSCPSCGKSFPGNLRTHWRQHPSCWPFPEEQPRPPAAAPAREPEP